MKPIYPYNPQTGLSDSTQTWSNGNPQTDTQGSIVSFQDFVNPATEIVNVIINANIVPSDADLTQLLQAIQHLIANAINAIPPVVFPTIPTYTGNSGVAIAGTVAKLDINSLTTTATIATTDYLAALVSGTDEKVSVAELAQVILSQLVAAAVSQAYATYRIYTSSGSFTPDAGCTGVELECWGAGGGGAFSGPVVAGGGGGGYSAGRFAVVAGQVYGVTIGSGGTGGTSGNVTGGTGGTSNLSYPGGGDLISATGGGGASINVPGAGGIGYGGQATYSGQQGGAGNAPGTGLYFPGFGGAAFGAGANVTTGVVYNGYNYGVGGTGGNSTGGVGATPNGGNGAPGLLIVKQIIV